MSSRPDLNSFPLLRKVTEEEALTHPNLCQAEPPDCLEMWHFYLPLLIYRGKKKKRETFS